jgi:hypothetical protein
MLTVRMRMLLVTIHWRARHLTLPFEMPPGKPTSYMVISERRKVVSTHKQVEIS